MRKRVEQCASKSGHDDTAHSTKTEEPRLPKPRNKSERKRRGRSNGKCRVKLRPPGDPYTGHLLHYKGLPTVSPHNYEADAVASITHRPTCSKVKIHRARSILIAHRMSCYVYCWRVTVAEINYILCLCADQWHLHSKCLPKVASNTSCPALCSTGTT